MSIALSSGAHDQMTTRILYVDHADLMGGAEQSLLRLMAGLDHAQFTPILACNPDTPICAAARGQGITTRLVDLGQLRGQRYPVRLMRTWRRGIAGLLKVIRQHDIQLVHSNVMRASLYAAPAARLAGMPLIWHVRDIHEERRYVRWMGRMAARIIVISQAVAEPLPAQAQHKIRSVPDGLDISRYGPDAASRHAFRSEFDIGADDLVVGHISWLSPWKQPDLFLKMAQAVAGLVPKSRFVIVGEAAHPSHREFVDNLKREAHVTLGERCIFTGAQSPIQRALAGFDLLVHTSRAEPLGLVIVEAMASGLPVAAFADGGVPGIIVDGMTGRLTPPGDMPALVNAVSDLLQHPEKRAAMGAAGRQRAGAEFSVARMVRRTEAVYDELLGRGRHDR